MREDIGGLEMVRGPRPIPRRIHHPPCMSHPAPCRPPETMKVVPAGTQCPAMADPDGKCNHREQQSLAEPGQGQQPRRAVAVQDGEPFTLEADVRDLVAEDLPADRPQDART